MYTIYYYVYSIRYRMFCCRKMILRSLTGPVHRDPSKDVEMDEDDQRDYEDYNYQVNINPKKMTRTRTLDTSAWFKYWLTVWSSPLMNWNLQRILSRRPLSVCLTLERP